MLDARWVSLRLAEAHSLLYSLRVKRPREVRLERAIAYLRPGEDTAFPSASSNKLQVFDPAGVGGVDVVETVRAGKRAFDEAGIGHWFVELGAGVTVEMVKRVCAEFGARPRVQVRYPVLAREAGGVVAEARTSLEVVRATEELVRRHAGEIDAVWEKPGAAGSMINAMMRPREFAGVLGMCDGRVVATGLVVMPEEVGGIAYFSAGGTHAEFRGRGGQSALIAERVRIAAERGRSVCVSETVMTVMTSTNNLLRAGFAPVFEWVVVEVGEFRG
jgi:ribosomal protein S18 acetylase RimI-like enzyme